MWKGSSFLRMTWVFSKKNGDRKLPSRFGLKAVGYKHLTGNDFFPKGKCF